ncbi:SNARE domain-containing protein [Planococcus lenghuensis]|uniref:YhjD n=1 Tax=Planococcus lenghuensis TaxID=2213202 RepID=A0A1Q2KY47_9BACL|nr:hypothetical protein [Planococcus lenghuensis]AQQ52582.1 hypothetical protein B0X71_05380 [Planococcus lenghuensis]
MPVIAQQDLHHFEKMIYLPMVLTVLALDRQAFEKGPFKLKRPYVEMVDRAMKNIHAELRETKIYLHKRQMKVLRGKRDDTFTEYIFHHGGYEQRRRYLNLRIRNRVEELICVYFSQTEKLD